MLSRLALVTLVLVVASAMKPDTEKYAGNPALPWMSPIDVCTNRKLSSEKSSQMLVCDGNQLVSVKYDKRGCKPQNHLYNVTVFCDGQTIDCNCIESVPSNNGKYKKNFAVIRLKEATVPPSPSRDYSVDTIQEMIDANNGSLPTGAEILAQKQNQVSCSAAKPNRRMEEIAIVTEQCHFYDYGLAKLAFADDPLNVDYEPNIFSVWEDVFPRNKFWYKVLCSGQNLLWQTFTDPDCTNQTATPKPFLIEEDTCQDWRIFGNFWKVKIKCKGSSFSSDDILDLYEAQSAAGTWSCKMAVLAFVIVLSLLFI